MLPMRKGKGERARVGKKREKKFYLNTVETAYKQSVGMEHFNPL